MAKTVTVAANELIASAWGNEIRDRTVQRFATIAERDAQWTPAAAGQGALCVVLAAPMTLYVSTGTAWVQTSPGYVAAPRVGTSSSWSNSTVTASDITVTAGVAPSIAGLALNTARRYRMTFWSNPQLATLNARGVFDFQADATVIATYAFSRNLTAALDEYWQAIFVPPDSAAHTYKMTGRSPDAAALALVGTSAPHPIQFAIEDVGAV